MGYQIKEHLNYNLNIVLFFGKFQIFEISAQKLGKRFDKISKIQVGYQMKMNFNHNLNVVLIFENLKIFGVKAQKVGDNFDKI